MPQPSGIAPSLSSGPTPLRPDFTPLRTYLLTLPFVTTTILLLAILIQLLQSTLLPTLRPLLSLDPLALTSPTWYTQLHRLNTYPLTHLSPLHAAANLLAFVPLSARFERFQGSARWAALALGPLVVFPGVGYVVVERFVLPGGGTTRVVGLSALVLTLFTIVAVNTSRVSPYIQVPWWRCGGGGRGGFRTIYAPLALVGVFFVVAPGGSVVGHLCGVAVGYLYGFGWLAGLEPKEWVVEKVEGVARRWGWLEGGWLGRAGWVMAERSGRGRGDEGDRLPTSFGGGGGGEGSVAGSGGSNANRPFEGVGRPLGS
ncbi:hypothetical protein DFH27DRAFT_603114 [Peziza echinospora]|nr:hypothetical protein DFH27DRAFT_603114 [Peziza echinospora]